MATGGMLVPEDYNMFNFYFMNLGKLAPDCYMMDFYPMASGVKDYNSSTLRYMKMGEVYDPLRRLSFETGVKEWLKLYITNYLPGETVVLAVAPGHLEYDISSFMYDLVGEFISDPENSQQLCLEDGRSLLVRFKTIEKQAFAGANRSEITHRQSIWINAASPLVNQGKVVVILDDVWTSGCTLRVCEEKVRTTGPKDVRLLAIGKTVPRM